MPLDAKQAADRAQQALEWRGTERARLDLIHDYLRDDINKRLPWLPTDAPIELHRLARMSRVNVMKFIVNSRVQSLYLDGYRTPKGDNNAKAWDTWLRNRFTKRQIGVHRAAIGYGAAYTTVLPGDPVPVLRGVSPRDMTAVYGDDDDWPEFALERRRSATPGRRLYRLYDDTASWWIEADEHGGGPRVVGDPIIHGATFGGVPVCPVVRYRDTDDLDDPVLGIVEPHMSLQDQINITSFGLQVAQHFGAFKQRYIIGWAAESEAQRLKASASSFLTFDEEPETMRLGEFSQTELSGYIASREASLRHLATVSQTPAHELTGQLINLSAEALAAAEASKQRAIVENRTVLGESHEQTLGLVTEMVGETIEPEAEGVWRDTESRSLAQVADALGKLVTSLGVPAQELWELIPGVTTEQLNRWKSRAAEADPLSQLAGVLDKQMAADQGAADGSQPSG